MQKLRIYISRHSWGQLFWAVWMSVLERFYSFFSRRFPFNKVAIKNFYNVVFQKGTNIKFENDELLSFTYPINNTPSKFLIRYKNSDPHVFLQVIKEAEYARLVELLQTSNIAAPKIIDAGSNIGLTTLYFKRFFPQAEIISIEPNTQSFDMLNKLVAANNFTGCKSYAVALWDKITHLKLQEFRDAMSWSFSLVETNNPKEALFPANTLQNILKENQWSKIDLLKIDIEGGEKKLFESQDFLNEILPVTSLIALEVHPEVISRNAIISILTERGFITFSSGELIIGINKQV